MSLQVKGAKSKGLAGLGAIAKQLGVDPRTPAGRAKIKAFIASRRKGARAAAVPGARRRGRRGITATELRGFRKVAGLLNRYFKTAPAAMKRRQFGKRKS